jgi:hypothetical protein
MGRVIGCDYGAFLCAAISFVNVLDNLGLNLYDGSMEILTPIFRALGKLFMQPIFLIFLLVVLASGSVYLYSEYRDVNRELSVLRADPDAAVQKDVEELIEKVSRLTDLPEGEEPTVATINDIDTIRDQSFFRNGQNGDRVLIYTEARRAILYRPETDKIIEVGPVNIGEQEDLDAEGQVEGDEESDEESSESEASAGIRLALSNATSTAGLTVAATDELAEKLPELDLDVVSRIDANNESDTTIVVDLSEELAGAAQQIADTLGGGVGEMPEGESTPDADILVILGNSYIEE